MKRALKTLGLVVWMGTIMGGAMAQSSPPSSPTPSAAGASNTLPQAPSGGTAGTAGPAKSAIGEPTEAERRAQKDSDKVQQICKGC